MWRVAGAAFIMSSEAAAGALIGWLLDWWLGTGTLWLTIGGVAGIAVGMTTFIRMAFTLSREVGPPTGRSGGAHDDDHHDE